MASWCRWPTDSLLDETAKSLDDPQGLAKKARDADRAVKVKDQTGRGGPADGDYGVDDKARDSLDIDQATDVSKLADSPDGLTMGGRKLAGYIYWCQRAARATELARRFKELGLSDKVHVAYIDAEGSVVSLR